MTSPADLLTRHPFALFRIKAGLKTPFATGWQEESTADPSLTHELFNGHRFNVGIDCEKSNIIVLDVDVKDGKPGLESLEMLQLTNDTLPATLTARTPSNGLHFFFKTPFPLRSTTSEIGEGLDTKSKGGYVVGPGSTTEQGHYAIDNDAPLADAPDWLLKLLMPSNLPQTPDVTADLDTTQNTARASEYLLYHATPAVSGRGGNHTTYITAAQVKDFGISETQCLALLHAIYNPRCIPPWPINDLAAIVEHAYHYGKNAPGIKASTTYFEAVPILPRGPNEPITVNGQPLWHASQLTPDTDEEYLIEHLIPAQGFGIAWGAPKEGKTFVTLSMGAHIAMGKQWFGYQVQQGAVIYLALEGGTGIKKRIAALCQHYPDFSQAPFYVFTLPVDLLNGKEGREHIVALIKAVEAEPSTPKVRLVVIDTLARAMPGGDENSQKDAGAFVGNVDYVRSAGQCAVVTIHHSGKNEKKGMRGSSAFEGALDASLRIKDAAVRPEKMRDSGKTIPLRFRLEEITVGQNKKGEPIKTCVMEAIDASNVKFDTLEMTAQEQSAILHLKELIDVAGIAINNGKHMAVDMETWREYLKWGKTQVIDKEGNERPIVSNVTPLQKEGANVTDFRKVWHRVTSNLVKKGCVTITDTEQCFILRLE